MNTNELKYKGEKFSIRWDSKEEILFIEFWGKHEKKDAEEYKSKFEEFTEKIPGTEPLSILADVSGQIKTSNEARRIYNEVSKHPRSGNSAICGASVLIRVVTAFIAATTRRKNIKSFVAAEEGLKWLNEKKAKRK